TADLDVRAFAPVRDVGIQVHDVAPDAVVGRVHWRHGSSVHDPERPRHRDGSAHRDRSLQSPEGVANLCTPSQDPRRSMTVKRPSFRLQTVCIDCADAHVTADFYGRLLGWEAAYREPEWVLLRCPDGGLGLSLQAEAGYRPP